MGEGGRMTGIGIQRRTGGLGFFVFFCLMQVQMYVCMQFMCGMRYMVFVTVSERDGGGYTYG